MIQAVEAVRERALRATAALAAAGVPYAVIGGNAVAAWVARVDRAADGLADRHCDRIRKRVKETRRGKQNAIRHFD